MSFYDDKEDVNNQPKMDEKIKLGEKEYSQEDLSRLVGLGEMAGELETKWNTKIDRLMPEYTKVTQTAKEKEAEIAALKEQLASKGKPEEKETVWDDKAKEDAKRVMKELYGDEIMTKKEVEEFYQTRRQADEIIKSASEVIGKAKELGKPEVSIEELLQHMNDTGIRSPEKAYKDLKEEELDKWKEEQLKSLKPSRMATTTGSTAGSKEPAEVKVTSSNLRELLKERFNQ